MSFDHKERNGSRNDCVNKENLEKIHEHVLRREERFLKKTKLIFRRWMKRPSRSTATITRRFMNRRYRLMTVASQLKGRDAISSRV